jgi:hypothetical protein
MLSTSRRNRGRVGDCGSTLQTYILITVLFADAAFIGHVWAAETRHQKVVLFTAQEARGLRLTIREWRHFPRTRALSVGPHIVVRQPPVVAGEIPTIEARSPTDLDVIFEPGQAPVQMDSLHVEARKGLFSKSLTDLLRPYIRGDRIEVTNLEIPSGRFMLNVSIADTNGNTTAASYLLEVR